MKARYNRISTPNQNMERQLVKQHPDELLFNDTISGSIPFNEREKGQELLTAIKNGEIDYVSISSVDRIGRNLLDILNTLEFFNQNNITLKVDNLGLESMVDGKPNPTFNLIISVLANVAQMERETLLERQKEGIALAKAKGIYKGRVRGSVEGDAVVLKRYRGVVKEIKKGTSLRRIVKLEGVSLGTTQKVKTILKNQNII